MTAPNRIILNTLANYGQSLVALVVGLFSARWVLQALGMVDFGLFWVVGSIIVPILFFNNGKLADEVIFISYSTPLCL